jgi:hypothetical protein
MAAGVPTSYPTAAGTGTWTTVDTVITVMVSVAVLAFIFGFVYVSSYWETKTKAPEDEWREVGPNESDALVKQNVSPTV